MIIYYEFEDIVHFETAFLAELHQEKNDWKQKIQKTNEFAKGICSGLTMAERIFIIALSKFKQGEE